MASLEEKVADKLVPKNLKKRLMFLGLFLMAFELFKDSVVAHIRDFLVGAELRGKDIDPRVMAEFRARKKEYLDDVVCLDSDLLIASCLWHVKRDVLTQQDVEVVRSLRNFRNRIGHEAGHLLLDVPEELDFSKFKRLEDILQRVDNWWGRIEVETGLSLEEDWESVKWDEIQSHSFLFVQYCRELVEEDAHRAPPDSPA